jgi:hypothetical protein
MEVLMPLSEQEQRLLDEMERGLYQNDAHRSDAGQPGGRPTVGAIALAVVGGVLGLGLLIAGVVLRAPIVGIVGFVVMFLGALVGFAPPRALRLPGAPRPQQPHREGFTAPWDSDKRDD